uniref:hypothetical protein n=1 Tax=Curvibacter lanceolatus TaxID=86182 RepID=UPI001B7F8D59
KFEIRPARLDQKLEGMNTDPTQSQKGTPMDMNPGDLESGMHDALVKVAGPMLEEQAEMRAQLGSHQLLLALVFADRFTNDRSTFDGLMTRLLDLTGAAANTLPGGPCTPEALAAESRVRMLLLQFQGLVGRTLAASHDLAK